MKSDYGIRLACISPQATTTKNRILNEIENQRQKDHSYCDTTDTENRISSRGEAEQEPQSRKERALITTTAKKPKRKSLYRI